MKKLRRYKMFLLLMLALTSGKAQQPGLVIDSIQQQINSAGTLRQKLALYFALADNYMEIDEYDSAQIWLNQISAVLPLRIPSIDNYFLTSRQAEVYYYNGLQRLGLQEAERSLSIALALKDSLLMADSYNFIGLFYVNLDSFRKAIPYFFTGLRYARQPPYSTAYLSLTKPHHLYGNLAEAYEKLQLYDSALLFSRRSLQLATDIQWPRGIAVAQHNLGTAHLKLNHPDSALYFFESSVATAAAGKDVDVELIGYAGLAKTAHARLNKTASLRWLQKGMDMLKQKSFVNALFKNSFLDDAIALYEKNAEYGLLMAALKDKAALLQKQLNDNNRQVNLVLNAGLQNETRLLQLQVSEEKQRNEINTTRLYLLISLLVLVLAGFFFYRYKIRQQLQVIKLQNKISQDLHDDVGSSLSSLQVYSTVADSLLETHPAKAREMLHKIARESTAVMENMGDIVWSMNRNTDQSLEERIKNFAADVLGASNMQYQIEIEDGLAEQIRNIEARKNILLLLKEAVNNTVKYSKAKHVVISIKQLSGHVCVQVADDGTGFSVSAVQKGQGLTNMQQRTLALGGMYEITSQPGSGTTVSALFPLTKISDQL